jgi:hypothetical protein
LFDAAKLGQLIIVPLSCTAAYASSTSSVSKNSPALRLDLIADVAIYDS